MEYYLTVVSERMYKYLTLLYKLDEKNNYKSSIYKTLLSIFELRYKIILNKC